MISASMACRPRHSRALQSSIEAMQLQTEVEDQKSGEMDYEGEKKRWSARDRTVIARMEQYLNANDSMIVEKHS